MVRQCSLPNSRAVTEARDADGRSFATKAICTQSGEFRRTALPVRADRWSMHTPAQVGRSGARGLPSRAVKPAAFDYHAPESVADVVALLGEHGDEAKVLAGGQSLVPMLALRLTRFEHLVDVTRVDELQGITRTNGTLRIAAATP